MHGEDFSFCEECLKSISADDFWKEISQNKNYEYPPKLSYRVQKAIDSGKYPSELISSWSESENIDKPLIINKKQISFAEKEQRKMTNSLRYKIFRRDGLLCVLCGALAQDSKLVIDHIISIAKKGKIEESNLRMLCLEYNSGKAIKLDNES